MTISRITFAATTMLAGLAVAGAAWAADKPVSSKPVPLNAMKVSEAPKLDGVADDAAWAKAEGLVFNAAKGANFVDGATTGLIKAVYTADTLYMLVQYDDPTLSLQRSPYVKQADGSWKKLTDPNDKGGDNNTVYEDKMSLIWNIDGSIFGFDEKFGCQAACHAGEPGKPYGNKYTSEEGELGDIWHLKSVRTGFIGQIDDQYLDHTRHDAEKAPGAGRKSDAKTGGGYANNKLVDGKPEFMNADGLPANKGGTYWVLNESKVAFDDSKFQPGDEVSSIVVSPFTGDRGDLSVGIKWENGKWTQEIARKLVTDSPTDVQFNDMAKQYGFGVAVFDNAQVRHAYDVRPILLTFK